ncbi:MAG: PDZ domain-containing protein [Bryobacteraceae bacterium]
MRSFSGDSGVCDGRRLAEFSSAGLEPGDVVLTVDGAPASASALEKTIESNPAGIKLRIARHGQEQEISVPVAPNLKRIYHFSEQPEPGIKRSILEAWLRPEKP